MVTIKVLSNECTESISITSLTDILFRLSNFETIEKANLEKQTVIGFGWTLLRIHSEFIFELFKTLNIFDSDRLKQPEKMRIIIADIILRVAAHI